MHKLRLRNTAAKTVIAWYDGIVIIFSRLCALRVSTSVPSLFTEPILVAASIIDYRRMDVHFLS